MADQRQLTFLKRVRDALTNATTEADLAGPLGEMGYDADAIAEGMALVTEAEREAREADTERREATAATKTTTAARTKVRQAYVRTVKLARSVFDDGSSEWERLGLSGDRPEGRAALVSEAQRFYEVLLGDAALLEAMAVRKVTQATVERSVADVEAAAQAGAAQVAEAGEAQVATDERDAAVDVVAGWWEDFWDVADVALDTPQLREKLGMQEAGS